MTIEETSKNTYSRIAQKLEIYFENLVISPIYKQIDNEATELESIGSGFFLQHEENYYFTTAAHCLLDDNNSDIEDKYWIFSNKCNLKINLNNQNIFQRIYLGNHSTNNDDIAIFKILTEFEMFDYINTYDIRSLSMNTLDSNSIYHGVAIGFPANKNASKHVYRKRGTWLKSYGLIRQLEEYLLKELDIDVSKNIVLDRGNCTYTEQGSAGNFCNSEGMSGGILISFSQDDLATDLPNPKLSGLLIESNHGKIKGGNHYFNAISINEIIAKLSN